MLFRILQTLLLINVAVSEQRCERLKATLSYTQEQAPRDLSGVLPVVVERVNRELEGVVDVEVEWTGSDLHGRVGDHIIQCKVTRLVSAIQQNVPEQDISLDSEGRRAIVQCFQLPFSITDTNECTLPKGHAMRHRCRDPAVCINTIGSYECLCPRLGQENTSLEAGDTFWTELQQQQRDAWELSYASSSKTSCPSAASTHGCCPEVGHSTDGKSCRSAFACPRDPCLTDSDCASNAQCIRNASPLVEPTYSCQCAKGLMGNGHKCKASDPKPRPMVKFDGVTPTEETLKNDYYCGCTKPEVDACAGFPPCKGHHEVCVVTAGNSPMCACKPGYVDNQDGYGCVDESPPILKLRPVDDQVMRLKQGEFYKEHAVDIVDENAEEYLRSLRITYSKPLPPGCLTEMGEFHVNYTVATPWTSYQFVRVTRRVVVDDIDECKLDVQEYSEICPELIPQCDTESGAKCVNTIGSYKCQCPKHTTGDGFKTIAGSKHPQGYQGGTGCVDTSKPIISILGPNPKILKVCKCGGLTGIMGGGNQGDGEETQACEQQRKKYGSNLKDLIVSTSGAELCATHRKPSPKPTECVKATDHTYKGAVDVTSRIEIGDPVEKSPLHWSIPYNVADAAGNKAATAWRDVIVEEVDIFGLEDRVRREILAEKEREVQDAVHKAVLEERAKHEQVEKVTITANRKVPETCPSCRPCNCSMETKSCASFNKSQCDKYCEEKYPTSCSASLIELVETIMTTNLVAAGIGVISSVFAIRFILTLLFNRKALFGGNDYAYANSGVVITTPAASVTQPRPPSFSDSLANGGVYHRSPEGGLFSPPENRRYVSNPTPTEYNGYDDDIYLDTSSSKTGSIKRGR